MAYKPAPGYAHNPLTKFRNAPCPCGSGKKAKKCHGQYKYIKEEYANNLKDLLKHGVEKLTAELIKQETNNKVEVVNVDNTKNGDIKP